ncbi:MAG: hypothetical protein N2513_10130 [Deltaproteobacteria bacterium]|nr:hypothetical protein [Deltaproteobacteria bacterium]
MKVLIHKVDLDTATVGFLLDVKESDEIIVVKDRAPVSLLMDKNTLCIEVGGSGLVEFNNFDHHDPEKYFPPAAKQAYEVIGKKDPFLQRLVEYVSCVDEGSFFMPLIPFPSLSNVFSGMLIVERTPVRQLLEGIKILRQVVSCGLDPFSSMPSLPEWKLYIEAKKKNAEKLKNSLYSVQIFRSTKGLLVGFLESEAIGGISALYGLGCEIGILFNPCYGEPAIRKFTIASKKTKLVNLLKYFDNIEPGWGGRETIIGSPRNGTKLKIEEVIDIVLSNL